MSWTINFAYCQPPPIATKAGDERILFLSPQQIKGIYAGGLANHKTAVL